MRSRTYIIINGDYEPIKYVIIEDNPNRTRDPDDDELMAYHIMSLGLDLETHRYSRIDNVTIDYIDKDFTPEDGWNC